MTWSESGSLSTDRAPQAGEEAHYLSFKKPPTHIGRQDLQWEEYRKVNKMGIKCQRISGARETVEGQRRPAELRLEMSPTGWKLLREAEENIRRKSHSRQRGPRWDSLRHAGKMVSTSSIGRRVPWTRWGWERWWKQHLKRITLAIGCQMDCTGEPLGIWRQVRKMFRLGSSSGLKW